MVAGFKTAVNGLLDSGLRIASASSKQSAQVDVMLGHERELKTTVDRFQQNVATAQSKLDEKFERSFEQHTKAVMAKIADLAAKVDESVRRRRVAVGAIYYRRRIRLVREWFTRCIDRLWPRRDDRIGRGAASSRHETRRNEEN